MKILITGAGGFIGNYVVKILLKNGHEVIATSRDIKEVQGRSWIKKVKYLPCDFEREKCQNFFEFFDKPQLTIHLAWQGLPNYQDLSHLEKNLIPQYFFIKNMVENGLKNLVIIGTCFEYGMKNGCLSEEMATNPTNAYGLAKDTLRKFVDELNKINDFQYKWIRLFYLYGKGQHQTSILEQLNLSLEKKEKVFNMSGGEQLRDYLPVKKAAEYIVEIALQKEISGIVNCCSGKPISIRKFVEEYLKRKKKNIRLNLGYHPYPTYEPMAFWGDNRKMLKILHKNHD